MTNRVLLSQSASLPIFKVSKSGYDVLTESNYQNLQFDISSNDNFSGKFIGGTILHSAFSSSSVTWTIPNTSTTFNLTKFTYTVNFGKSYSSPPMVILRGLDSGSSFLLSNRFIVFDDSQIYVDKVISTTTTTTLVIDKYNRASTSPVNNPILWDIQYIVCQK